MSFPGKTYNNKMALTFRGVVVLLTGTVLGFGLALSSTVWHTFMARAKAEPAPAVDPSIESAALVAGVIDRVRREYVDKIDDKRIVAAAIRGIVADLDQHSTFLDAEAYEDIRISTTGNYTGVGLDVNLEGGKVTVVAPLDGAPADRAGILPGDVVSAVDDVPVSADDVAASVARMRGEPGTTVTLDVQRPGSETPLKFALTRTELQAVLRRAGIEASGLRLAYLVMHAELEQLICSGPRRGRQFTYALLDRRAPTARRLDRPGALLELTRRYFTSHGPATLRDFGWWSGLTMRESRASGIATNPSPPWIWNQS